MPQTPRRPGVALPSLALGFMLTLAVLHLFAGNLLFAAVMLLFAAPVAVLVAQRWTGV